MEGWIKEDKGRLILAEGKAFKQDGNIVAVAQGTYFKIKGQMKEHVAPLLRLNRLSA